MRSRVFAVFGMLCLVCGGVVLAGSTFGFASVATDRGISADTAQEGAYVGLEPVDESISGRQDTATVARVHNNLGSSMSLDTTVSQGDDLAVESGFGSSVAAGDSTGLTLACAGGGGSGTQAVTVLVDQATADGVTIEGATITVEVDYQCTGNSKGQLSVQSVSQTGTGTVAFEVENSGSKGAKIKGASIDDTTSDAIEVDDPNAPAVSIDGAAVVDADQPMTIDGTEYGGGQPVTIPAESTATVTIGQFRTSDDTAVDMEGETVEFTLYGNGQSSYSLSGATPVSEGDSIETGGSATVENGGEVDGDVDAGGDVTARSESEIGGDVSASGDVSAGSGSEIDGSVDSSGDVTAGSESEVGGDVDAGGDVTAGSGGEVGGDVNADGSLTARSGSEIDGGVDAGGGVTAGSGSEFGGDLSAGGGVTVRSESEIGGDLQSGDDVTISSGAEIDGGVDTVGDIIIRSGAEIGGDVDASGDVTIGSGAEIDGSVSADGTVTDNR